MKSYTLKFVFCCAAFGLSMFVSCSNDNTIEAPEASDSSVVSKDEVDDKGAESDKISNGKDGKSCYATQDEKTKDIIITCETDDGKGVSYTIKNGSEGSAGKSAYELAKDNGFTGSESEWLASLVGGSGKSACAQALGKEECSEAELTAWVESLKGDPGASGKSACAQALGKEECSEAELTAWVESLKGDPGASGKSACAQALGKEECSEAELTAWAESLKGDPGASGKSACAQALGKEECSEAELTAWVESLKGNPGASGKSACAQALGKDECSEAELTAWVESLKGNPGASGKSACAQALGKEECSEAELTAWAESLKGDPGKSCTVSDTTDEATGRTGYRLTCGDEYKGVVWNGHNGRDGDDCTVANKANGVVEVKCGEYGTPVTLYKAMCGAKSYNPEEMVCVDGELYKSCNSRLYNPEKSKCVDERVVVTPGTMIDTRDNNREYKIVSFDGTYMDPAEKTFDYKATWMAENLNYVVDDWTHSWCYDQGSENVIMDVYKNNCVAKGRLYDWTAAKNACPAGWRLPSIDEWEVLRQVVGGFSVAGKSLRSTSGWNGHNGTDAYSFTALPAGVRSDDGSFANAFVETGFWSETEIGSNVYYLHVSDETDVAGLLDASKGTGLSVRCIKSSN